MYMRSFVALAAILLIIVPLCADTPKDTEAKQDLEKLQGKWKVVSIEENGRATPANEVANFEVTIKGDLFSIRTKDEEPKELTIKLDPNQKPAIIDLKAKAPKEKNVMGIYKLDGDTLTICATDENKERPKEFSATKGVAILVMKRAK